MARAVRSVGQRRYGFGKVDDLAGFAVEGWPSLQHTEDAFLFFNARGFWELAVNIAVMLRSVTGFTSLAKVQGRSYGEYIYE